MKKFLSFLLIFAFLICTLTSCSKAEIKDTSQAGIYCLMFKELVETKADITKYRYLSFDKDSCYLEGEELDTLVNFIKDYCEDVGVEYLEKDLVGLRRAFKIEQSLYGETFTEGYLLSFGPIDSFEDGDGVTYYTADINFWHGDMDGIGGREFFIVKTDDGWYLDREQGDGGYSTMLQ